MEIVTVSLSNIDLDLDPWGAHEPAPGARRISFVATIVANNVQIFVAIVSVPRHNWQQTSTKAHFWCKRKVFGGFLLQLAVPVR